MGIADIQAAIKSIPAKKENLRQAFKELESYSSFFAAFTLQWKDIDEHFSSIENSIDTKFQKLKAMGGTEKPIAANVKVDQDKPAIEPRPELKSFCVKMDSKGLILFIIGHRRSIAAVRGEIGPALLCSPDPVALVLDSFEGFLGCGEVTERETQAMRRAYLAILGCFHGLKLEVKPSDKERARGFAVECHSLIKNGEMGNSVVVMVFLYLIATFGLLEHFTIDDILDLLVTVAEKKNVVDICRNFALEEKMHDLIYMLNRKGRQIDSIKFVVAFNLHRKFPPAALFKAYLKESKKDLQKGNNSAHLTQHEAISKQITAIKEVIKVVEEYNLGSQYPLGSLLSRIRRLEEERLLINKRRGSPISKDQKRHDQPPAKRPRPPSDSSATVLLPQHMPSNYAPNVPSVCPQTQYQPQSDPANHSPYAGLASSHGSIADPSGNSLSYPIGLYSAVSAYYGRPVVPHGGCSDSGFPP